MIEFISQPWPWYFSGMAIAVVMFLLVFFGKNFGFSSNFRHFCAACGGAKYSKFLIMIGALMHGAYCFL